MRIFKLNKNVKSIQKTGFTLVELLVVITIMSILTVITVSQFQTARAKARDAQRKGDISALAKALEMYYADYGEFPGVDADGRIRLSDTTVAWGGEFTVSDGHVYMKVVPKENYITDTPYCYAVSADRNMFGLFSVLENDQDGDYNRLSVDPDDAYFCNGNQVYNFAILSPNADLADIPHDF